MCFKKVILFVYYQILKLASPIRDLITYYVYKKCLNNKTSLKDGVIRVGFILQFPEMWSSFASVYNEMEKDNRINPIVIAVPKRNSYGQREFEEKNDALLFCLKMGISAINGLENEIIFPLESLGLDYIIIQRAYDFYMPDGYKLKQLQRIAPICYISYSGRTTKGKHISIEFDSLLRYFSILFADCTEVADYVRKKNVRKLYSKYQKIYDIGFPRFDLIEPKELSCYQYKTFLWTPRWTVFKTNGSSHFITYFDALIEYFRVRKDLSLVIRPHPLLFDACINHGLKTKEEIENLRRTIEEIPNISLDESDDYQNSFNHSDALISDGSSLLLMYFFTGKPVIWTKKSEDHDDYTEISKRIFSTFYGVSSITEVFHEIEKLLDGKDNNKEAREALISELLPKEKRSCKRIVEAIHEDYYERNVHA